METVTDKAPAEIAGARTDGGRLYRRVFGGFVPPIDNNYGHCIVLGEEHTLRESAHMWFLREIKEPTLERLLERMTLVKMELQVDSYFYRPAPALNRSLDYWNTQREKDKMPGISTRKAPYVDDYKGDLEYYLTLIRQISLAGRERLYLVGSNLPDVLGNIGPDEVRAMKDTTNPRIAALCYAVASLELMPYHRPHTDYGVTELQHELHKLQTSNDGGPWRVTRR